MTEQNNTRSPQKSGGWFAGGGLVAGGFAFIGASCCVLPILLVNLGLSSALVGNLALFARYQVWFQWLTLGLLVAGFYFSFRHGRPRKRVIVLLIIAVLLAGAAYILPSYERDLLRWLNL